MKAVKILLVVSLFSCGTALGAETILTENSVWRSYWVWMPPVQESEKGPVPMRVWGTDVSRSVVPPPAGWEKPEFDDSRWMVWRETHVAHTLKKATKNFSNPKPEDLEDTGIRHYDLDQYGALRSNAIGLRCFRGRFDVQDPAGVSGLKLTVEFRGGLRACLNGEEILRAHLPEGDVGYDTLAAQYAAEAHTKPDGKAWTSGHANHSMPSDPELIKRYNTKVRSASAEIPSSKLKKGVNVLALEIHRAPSYPKDTRYSNCGLVAVNLSGEGKVASSAGRPDGVQVWNANALTKVTPLGFYWTGRIGQGVGGYFTHASLSWGESYGKLSPIRMVGARSAVAVGQLAVSSDAPIKGLDVKAGDLVMEGGKGTISKDKVQVLYEGFPEKFPERDVAGKIEKDPAFAVLNILREKPPAEIKPFEAKQGPPASFRSWKSYVEFAGCGFWNDGGAVAPVWLKVDIPADAPAGEYRGAVTVTTAGAKPTEVPVVLRVADWVVPKPVDFTTHVGTVHSPDTLSLQYKVPIWSEEHWKLVEKTLSFMSELGGKVVYLPLTRDFAWFHNSESLVYWVKQADGTYARDFRQFDRYLDLVQKYLKPEITCLCVLDGDGFSVWDPATKKVDKAPLPPYAATPEGTAFWKPLLEETLARLEKRGLGGDKVVLGLLWEGNTGGKGRGEGFKKESMELFNGLVPNLKLAQLAHYGARGGWKLHGVPIGYAMSVWGNVTGVKAKVYGARDVPIKVGWHPRCDPIHDLRPMAARGSFLTVIERASEGCIGLSPVGMDFWNLAEIPKGRGPRKTGSIEGCIAWNLNMCLFTSAAILAPGPDGPVPTVRFELMRLGLYRAEARGIVERALADPASKAKLGETLAKRCRAALDARNRAIACVVAGEHSMQGEGWKWFEASGWEDRTLELFSCAGEVTRAVEP